jgi:hypothetical protein
MTDAAERGDDRSRGEHSREGYSENDERHPIKRSAAEPNLTPPAGDINQPTHPESTGGLGRGGRTPDAPVPSGDPNTESERTELQ